MQPVTTMITLKNIFKGKKEATKVDEISSIVNEMKNLIDALHLKNGRINHLINAPGDKEWKVMLGPKFDHLEITLTDQEVRDLIHRALSDAKKEASVLETEILNLQIKLKNL